MIRIAGIFKEKIPRNEVETLRFFDSWSATGMVVLTMVLVFLGCQTVLFFAILVTGDGFNFLSALGVLVGGFLVVWLSRLLGQVTCLGTMSSEALAEHRQASYWKLKELRESVLSIDAEEKRALLHHIEKYEVSVSRALMLFTGLEVPVILGLL